MPTFLQSIGTRNTRKKCCCLFDLAFLQLNYVFFTMISEKAVFVQMAVFCLRSSLFNRKLLANLQKRWQECSRFSNDECNETGSIERPLYTNKNALQRQQEFLSNNKQTNKKHTGLLFPSPPCGVLVTRRIWHFVSHDAHLKHQQKAGWIHASLK